MFTMQAYELIKVKEMLQQLHEHFLNEEFTGDIADIRHLECSIPFLYRELGVDSASHRKCLKYEGDDDYPMCRDHIALFEKVITKLRQVDTDEDVERERALQEIRKDYMRSWNDLV
jgi:hypothetical protein